MPLEIACDESGFTGGNLTFRHAVFTHASVQVSAAAAADEMTRLRRRVAAHGELKASWLLRWCDRDDLVRFLTAGDVFDGAVVHVADIRLFLLARLCDVLLGSHEVSGLDLPGADPDTWAVAVELHGNGEQAFGIQRWQAFLTTAGNSLRTNSRWVPATAAADLESALAELAALPSPEPLRDALRLLRTHGGRVRAVRRSLASDARRPPLLEPLLPALDRAVQTWGADHPSLVVVHDEQSALTTWRVAEMRTRLTHAHPGHRLEVIRVDSREDARVQIADLVAGIARRAAVGRLRTGQDSELLDLVRPLVDATSVWTDDCWLAGRSRESPG